MTWAQVSPLLDTTMTPLAQPHYYGSISPTSSPSTSNRLRPLDQRAASSLSVPLPRVVGNAGERTSCPSYRPNGDIMGPKGRALVMLDHAQAFWRRLGLHVGGGRQLSVPRYLRCAAQSFICRVTASFSLYFLSTETH